MNEEEILEFLRKEENKGFLLANGFQTEVEKKVEVPQPLNEKIVEEFIKGNQSFSDKFKNQTLAEFLKKRTGKEEVTPEMLGKNLIFEEEANGQVEKIKNNLIEAKIGGKYSGVLMKLLDTSKIKWEDGNLNGMDEQVAELKTTYPDLFVKGTNPTPAPPKHDGEKSGIDKAYEKARETGNSKGYFEEILKLQEE